MCIRVYYTIPLPPPPPPILFTTQWDASHHTPLTSTSSFSLFTLPLFLPILKFFSPLPLYPTSSHLFSFPPSFPLDQRLCATEMSKPAFLKVVLLGDGGVGKSSLIQRFVSNKFDPSLFHTIGVEFLNKDLEVDGERYTLQIWDTAGQERFKSLRTPFYRGSDCCLLTYAIDDPQSFQNIAMWKKEFLYYADVKDPENFPFVVLGNKIDLASGRKSKHGGSDKVV